MIEARNGLYEAQKDGFRLEWELPGTTACLAGHEHQHRLHAQVEVWPAVLYISSIKAI